MNKNVLIVLIVGLLLIVGVVWVRGNSTSQPAAQNNQVASPTDAPAMEREDPNEPTDTTEEQNEVITLSADGFTPSSVSIDVGEKVVWENKSGGNATVDSDNHPTHQRWPFLNLGSFQDGEKHELVFDQKGTYTYHDHFNPGKKGTVVVE